MNMENSKIKPDVVDYLPAHTLDVTYNGATIAPGTQLAPTQVKDAPTVAWPAQPDTLYTLVMVDPDAPSRQLPIAREVRHWLVVNVPENRIEEGQTVYEYVGAGPPEKSGLHRYVLLVFKQKAPILHRAFISKSTKEGRLRSKTRDLITTYNLEAKPVAGSFFLAEYDDYVKVLDDELGWGAPKVVKLMLSAINVFKKK